MVNVLRWWNDVKNRTLWNKVMTFVFSVWIAAFAVLSQPEKVQAQTYYWQELVDEFPKSNKNFILEQLRIWNIEIINHWSIETKKDLEKLKKLLSRWKNESFYEITWLNDISPMDFDRIINALYDNPNNPTIIWNKIRKWWEWDEKIQSREMISRVYSDFLSLFRLYNHIPQWLGSREVYRYFLELCINIAEFKNRDYWRNIDNKIVDKNIESFIKYILLVYSWEELKEVKIGNRSTIFISTNNIDFLQENYHIRILKFYSEQITSYLSRFINESLWLKK
jgi:hypothetical protein